MRKDTVMTLTATGYVRPSPLLRASDQERESVVAQLGEHCAAGRLTVDELADRAQAAYAARTVGDLDALLADLPPLLPPHHAQPLIRSSGRGCWCCV
jgi:hypothetical protein